MGNDLLYNTTFKSVSITQFMCVAILGRTSLVLLVNSSLDTVLHRSEAFEMAI